MAPKPLSEMSLDELTEERDMWDGKIARATSWGAALAAAKDFLDDCDREIARRKAAQ